MLGVGELLGAGSVPGSVVPGVSLRVAVDGGVLGCDGLEGSTGIEAVDGPDGTVGSDDAVGVVGLGSGEWLWVRDGGDQGHE